MSYSAAEERLHTTSLLATADVVSRRFVAFAGRHALPGDVVAGVSQHNAAAGEALGVTTSYSALVLCAGAVNRGDRVGPAPDGSGRAVAGAGPFMARGDAADGAVVEVVLEHGGFTAAEAVAAVRLAQQEHGRKSPGNVLVDWHACTISGVTAGWSVEKSTDVLYAGVPTLKVSSTGGAATTMDATLTLPTATYFGSPLRLHCAVRPGNRAITGDNNRVTQIWMNYSAGSQHKPMVYAGAQQADEDWAVGTLYDGEVSGSGHITGTATWDKVNAETVTTITLRITSAGDVTEPLYISCFFSDQLTPPVLTLFMDGQYGGQYSLARHALQAANIRASLAIVCPWITSGEAGTMTAAQVSAMYDAGHECIYHTGAGALQGWNNTAKYPDGQEYALVRADVEAAWAMFRAHGWARGVGCGVVGNSNGFVSSQTLARRLNIKAALRDAGLRHIRPVGATLAAFDSHFEHGASTPLVKTETFRAVSTTTSANIDSYVNALIVRGGWGAVTLHDVKMNAASGNDINIPVLEGAMANIVDKVADGRLRVLPFSEAMAAIELPNLRVPA